MSTYEMDNGSWVDNRSWVDDDWLRAIDVKGEPDTTSMVYNFQQLE